MGLAWTSPDRSGQRGQYRPKNVIPRRDRIFLLSGMSRHKRARGLRGVTRIGRPFRSAALSRPLGSRFRTWPGRGLILESRLRSGRRSENVRPVLQNRGQAGDR